MKPALLLLLAAAFTLVACKSDEDKQREALAAPLARARPFLDTMRKAQTPPGPLADCAGKPAPQPTVVFTGPDLKRSFDLAKPFSEPGSALWRNPQGHPCWTFDASMNLRDLDLFVQKGELNLSGGTVAAASKTAECGEGIASFVVIYTTARVDMKLVGPKTYTPGSATVRAVVFTKAGAPTCEQSFSLGLDQPSAEDPHRATDLNIETESARLVKKAFALKP